MNKLLPVIIVLLCCLLLFSCNKDTSNPTNPIIPKDEWRTVFLDDFNRANTVNGDLGSNWTVCDTTNVSIMQIANNEIHAESEIQGIYEPVICPYAYHYPEIRSTPMRISVKVRTGVDASQTNIILFAEANTILSDGYFIGYDGNFFMEGKNNTLYTNPGNLYANTTYMLEIIMDSNGFEASMKDSATDNNLAGGYISGEFHMYHYVGFQVGGLSPNAAYVDDFKLEVPK